MLISCRGKPSERCKNVSTYKPINVSTILLVNRFVVDGDDTLDEFAVLDVLGEDFVGAVVVDVAEDDGVLAGDAHLEGGLGVAVAHATRLGEDGGDAQLVGLLHHVFHYLLGAGGDAAGGHSYLDLHQGLGVLRFLADVEVRLELLAHGFQVSQRFNFCHKVLFV